MPNEPRPHELVADYLEEIGLTCLARYADRRTLERCSFYISTPYSNTSAIYLRLNRRYFSLTFRPKTEVRLTIYRAHAWEALSADPLEDWSKDMLTTVLDLCDPKFFSTLTEKLLYYEDTALGGEKLELPDDWKTRNEEVA